MVNPLYIAIDLGAGSGRVFLAGLEEGEFLLEEIRRFQYPPIEDSGCMRWNFKHIIGEIQSGLHDAANEAKALGRTIRSIGIDSWGVDYGLLDANGDLISNPVSYRDDRTTHAMEQVFRLVPPKEIFEKTGIQFQNFNTLYQLFSEAKTIDPAAKTMLLIPDLVGFFLSGTASSEYTNATTTQMVNVASGNWDLELLGELGLPTFLLPKIVPTGTDLGKVRSEIATKLDLQGVHVVAPGTHDTASAVAAAPLRENWAYISSGTWSLIGVERADVLINAEVERQNFTNEGGVYGTIRFLKNVMGLWIFESCRREWRDGGIDVEYETILREINGRTGFRAFIFPDDPGFLNPRSMIDAIGQQLNETGQKVDSTPAAIAKIIFDSLAFRYASVLRSIESITGNNLEGIMILGGGSRNDYLNQTTADASGLPARAGLPEATVVGNALVQSISWGRFDSLALGREHIASNCQFKTFAPIHSQQIDEASALYASIERRFLN